MTPIEPKAGTVKAQLLAMLRSREGICRRDAASADVYELSNRIGELAKDGWPIQRTTCERHQHRQLFTLYSLPRTDQPSLF